MYASALERVRVSCVVAAVALATSAAQSTTAQTAVRPDTVAARRIVDSLVRAGAWTRQVDTVRLADTSASGVPIAAAPSPLEWWAFVVATLVLVALAVSAIAFGTRFAASFRDRSLVGVRSQWGTFGGGDGGWEASPALTLLLVTLVLGALAAFLASGMLDAAKRDRDAGPSSKATQGAATVPETPPASPPARPR
jgi:hypothetical protein